MLLPSAGFTSAYKKIVQNALDSDSSIIIFVACECDALCSCKIFTVCVLIGLSSGSSSRCSKRMVWHTLSSKSSDMMILNKQMRS